ncbi:hypothetical protein RvVAR031_24910 [Agrobacterium vitis]|nr:hypothetical protein RvVAR031_24910 [Agrobacterium vitis]
MSSILAIVPADLLFVVRCGENAEMQFAVIASSKDLEMNDKYATKCVSKVVSLCKIENRGNN